MTIDTEGSAAERRDAAGGRSPRLRVGIVAVLLAAIAGVGALAAAAFVFTVFGATETVQGLLHDRNERIVAAEVDRVRDKLEPVRHQVDYVAGLVATGRLDVEDAAAALDALAALLDVQPQVWGAGIGVAGGALHRVQRAPAGLVRDSGDARLIAGASERYRRTVETGVAHWGEIIWSPLARQPLVNLRAPLRRDGRVVGALLVTVAMGALSQQLVEPTLDPERANFILVDRDRVLAHRRLADPAGLGLADGRPLPRIDEVGDPVLAAIWSRPVEDRRYRGALGALGRVVDVEGRRFVFVYRELSGYDRMPWLVGRYYPMADVDRQLEGLREGAALGGAVLLVGAAVAFAVGRRIARPIRTLGRAAGEIERLEFDGAPLPRSSLLEIDEAAQAFNKTRTALRLFGAYVPRRLVRRLIEEGEAGIASKRRTVTVMFTDIVSFTPEAEELDERAIEGFLNEHFALLAEPIDRNGGVIDKFIGDAVMAVWGGIKRMPDHADAACRAAQAIAEALRADNARRREAGLRPVRLRIGLHSGPVVVGNIGAPGRLNYTVVGDTVNIANRLEQLGKAYMGEAEEIVVLASADTVATMLRPEALVADLGPARTHDLRGRNGPVQVHRLI